MPISSTSLRGRTPAVQGFVVILTQASAHCGSHSRSRSTAKSQGPPTWLGFSLFMKVALFYETVPPKYGRDCLDSVAGYFLAAINAACAARTGSGAIMHAAIGCESPPMTGGLIFPSVGQVRKPGLKSVGLGGMPLLCNVSSTLLYQVPTLQILRASSAVATLRPNSLQRRTTP